MHASQNNPQSATAHAVKGLKGNTRVPGDKSISHRALMLASQALGTTRIHGLLEGEDVMRTATALEKCGIPIHKTGEVWEVSGRGIGGLHEPSDILDMGNAGTASRLMMGLLASYPYTVHFTGDDSLKKRPMKRVMTPLEQIGASFMAREGGRLPLAMKGTSTPMPITYELPVASAQVKSAILLAGLNTPGTTTVIEREATRDHTERMLRFFGVEVESREIELESKVQDGGLAQGSFPHRGKGGMGAATTRTLKFEHILNNARELRKNMTDAEQLLWKTIRKEQLGVKFRRQHPVGRYIADFACLEPKLIVELDGGQHNEEEATNKDAERTRYLEAAGFTVIRFWNNDVLENIEGVAETIAYRIIDLDINGQTETRTLYPSPIGGRDGWGRDQTQAYAEDTAPVSPHPILPPMGEGVPASLSRNTSTTKAVSAIEITLNGQPAQTPQDRELFVPADPSSAAFPIVAALLVPDSEVTVTNVCLNPLRTGLFDVLKKMGANITISNQHEVGGEPVGDITARSSQLREIDVPAHVAPSMIDEYPILAVAAACANGKSVMRGLSELRVKESDRLAAIIAGLRANGIEAKEDGDDLIVYGKGAHPPGGGTVATHYDHRIAMSFLILGLVTKEPVKVDDIRAIATSFPSFMSLMRDLGAKFIIERKAARPTPERRMVVTVDGPAASGKGSLARRLAYHFGLGYLDTGLLYRAVGMRVLYANQDPTNAAAAIAAARAINSQDLANPKLRGERIGQAASIVSAMPEVREILLDYQRKFAMSENGAVLDGRDTGTVICPDADYKFFITASLDARAKRRHKELQDYGVKVDYQSVYEDLKERDERDAGRSIAPMKPADDATVIDTSRMTMTQVFDKVMSVVEQQPD